MPVHHRFSNVMVEEYDPATNTGALPRRRATARSGGGYHHTARFISWASCKNQITRRSARFEAYDPATNTWQILQSMPVLRHGVAAFIGNKLHFVSGRLLFRRNDTQLKLHHDVYEVID
jgi:hypothetical protein